MIKKLILIASFIIQKIYKQITIKYNFKKKLTLKSD